MAMSISALSSILFAASRPCGTFSCVAHPVLIGTVRSHSRRLISLDARKPNRSHVEPRTAFLTTLQVIEGERHMEKNYLDGLSGTTSGHWLHDHASDGRKTHNMFKPQTSTYERAQEKRSLYKI